MKFTHSQTSPRPATTLFANSTPSAGRVFIFHIMEIKDEGETLNLYGTSSDDGSSIEDIILYVPEDHTLICLFGSISSQKIADIVKM